MNTSDSKSPNKISLVRKNTKTRLSIITLLVLLAVFSTAVFSATTSASSLNKFFENNLPAPIASGLTSISNAVFGTASVPNASQVIAVQESAPAPSVMTDKDDYQPGEWATITGAGFIYPDADGNPVVETSVTLQVLHVDGTPNTGNGHEMRTVSVNGDGTFTTQWYVDPDDSLGAIFKVTAIGTTSGLKAERIFTDGPLVACSDISGTFESLSSGSSTWTTNSATGWKELENVPIRVALSSTCASPATPIEQNVKVQFDHHAGQNPGIQDLLDFVPSTGVQIITAPLLDAPANSGVWSYTFKIRLTASTGNVQFKARLSAGSHNFTGNSLQLKSSNVFPLGTMGIFKPGVLPGSPDLALTKSGPGNATPGQTVTYTLNYQNKSTAVNAATGVQLVDTLPSNVTYVPGSCGFCRVAGSTITWDIGSLPVGATGSRSLQVTMPNVSNQTITNSATLFLAENDVNPADNTSTKATVISTNQTGSQVAIMWSNSTFNGSANSATAQVQDSNGAVISGATATLTYYSGNMATGTALAGAPTNAGTYTVNASFAGNTNYTSSSNRKTITIGRASLQITASSPSAIEYGAAVPTVTADVQGLVGTDQLTTLATCGTAYTVGSVVGPYATTCSGAAASANYSITYVNGSFDVVAKPVTITPTSGQSKVFGAANFAMTFTNDAGLTAGSFTGALSRVSGEDVGSYAINLGTLSAGSNYQLSLSSTVVNFAITAKSVTITPTSGQSKVFGTATDPALTFTNDASLTGGFTGALSRAAGEDAGNYAISLGSLSAGNNYALSLSTPAVNFAITAKPVTITPTSGQSKVFGAANFAMTFTNDAGLTAGSFTGALSRVVGEDVGSYLISLGNLSAGNNYTLSLSSTPVNFAITAKPVTITPTSGQSKVFGTATDPALTFTNDASLTGGFTGALSRAAGEDAGNYAISLGSLSAGNNYALSLSTPAVNFVITAKLVTVTASSPSGIQFGAATPTVTAGYNGFNGSDAATTAATCGAVSYTAGTSGVGNYVTRCSSAVAANYSFTYVDGSFNVVAKSVTITPTSGQSKVFGTADPALTFTNDASLTGSSFTGALSRAPGTDVGSYAINLGSLSAGNNYALSLSTPAVNFAITAKPVTITPTSGQSKAFGAANFAMTFTNDAGLTAGSFSGTLARVAGENVGSYLISLGNLSAGNNYTLSLSSTPVNFTIVAANTSTTVTINPQPVQYSDAVTLTASISPASLNSQSVSGNVQFFVDGNVFGSPVTISGGTASLSFNNQLNPTVAHTVRAEFTSSNPNFGGSVSGNTLLTITREDARATYTGMTFASTASATASTANVMLSATIQDITAVAGNPAFDSDAGDITNARVTFALYNGSSFTNISTGCTNLQVGLVNAADSKTGTVTCNWVADIGNQDSVLYTVATIVNGYYVNNSAGDTSVITVSKSIGTGFITGGGYLVLTNSAGIKAGDVGSKNNFGFNVKYNRSGTSLQGNINTIVRRIENGVLRVYQIKGNAMSSLSVNPTAGCPNATATNPCTAVFTGKANIQDITNPLAPVSVDGNGSLKVTMTDKGEPGVADSIGITLLNRDGGVWFTSNWNGTNTVEQLLKGGNLVVR